MSTTEPDPAAVRAFAEALGISDPEEAREAYAIGGGDRGCVRDS